MVKRLVRSAIFWTGAWFLAAFAVAFLMTHRIFGRAAEPPPTLDWGTVESFRLSTSDGEELGAWFIDCPDGCGPAVLFLHGVKADRYQLLGVAREFHGKGCPVLLISQRGHGDSTGGFNDFGYSFGPDAVAAVDWLRQRTPDRNVVVWGTSMGAATALFAAKSLGDKVAGYILECPYQNLRIATRNRTKACLPPVVEDLAYRTLCLAAAVVLPDVDRIAPEEAAAEMPNGVPVLIFVGECDCLALPTESHAIAQRIGASAKVVVVPGGRHGSLFGSNGDLLRSEIDAFLRSASGGQRRDGKGSGVPD